MRFGIVAVAGLMAAAGAQGQQAGSPSSAQLEKNVATIETSLSAADASRYVVLSAGCPGQLQARQQATGGGTVWTTSLEDQSDRAAWTARPSGLGIHVEFAGAKAAVKTIELRVSYLPLGLRRMALDLTSPNTVAESPRERAKTFNLDREAAMRIGGDLLVGPAATITHVHLVSATFADGSVWNAPNEDACSILPSKYMLVEAKR